MPLRLNVGLSKKVGQPDYGSLGASCNVEVELDAGLLTSDLETFHRHVRNAYVACAQAVNDELARHDGGQPDSQAPRTPEHTNGNGHTPATNGHGTTSNRASQKQFEYARQLAAQIKGLGVRRLEGLAGNMFSKPLADLTSLEASGLIDVLKDVKAGKIELGTIPNGAQA